IIDAVSVAVAWSMSAHTTVAPASARRAEMARPRPRPAPVTRATRSVRSKASEMVVMARPYVARTGPSAAGSLTLSTCAQYGAAARMKNGRSRWGVVMRAVRVVQHAAPLEALELQDIPVPEPGPGE